MTGRSRNAKQISLAYILYNDHSTPPARVQSIDAGADFRLSQ
jgi:hypothetical protein